MLAEPNRTNRISVQNGFRACGLYPLNPNAVNYNILNKQKKRKAADTSPSCAVVTENEDNRNMQVLHVFEKNIISPSILEAFKKDEFNESWTGEVCYQKLFESWLQLKKFCSGKDGQDSNLHDGDVQDCNLHDGTEEIISPSTSTSHQEIFSFEDSYDQRNQDSIDNSSRSIDHREIFSLG